MKEYNYILEKQHCFLKRNSDLLRSGNEPLTESDLQLLEKYNMKANVKSGCESWLLKWISIVLRTVDQEHELYFNDQKATNVIIAKNDKDISNLKKAIARKEAEEAGIVLPTLETNESVQMNLPEADQPS